MNLEIADFEWRGLLFKQWYGSPRTAELKSEQKDGSPTCYVKATRQKKGMPIHYEARIYMGRVSSEASAPLDPLAALNSAANNIFNLNHWLECNAVTVTPECDATSQPANPANGGER